MKVRYLLGALCFINTFSHYFSRSSLCANSLTVNQKTQNILIQVIINNNSDFTNFLYSDWLFGRLYTLIKAMRKNTQFLS